LSIKKINICFPLLCCRQLLAPNLMQKDFLAGNAEQMSKQVKYFEQNAISRTTI